MEYGCTRVQRSIPRGVTRKEMCFAIIVSAARESRERRTNGDLYRDATYLWRKIYKSAFRGCFQRAFRGDAHDSDAVH